MKKILNQKITIKSVKELNVNASLDQFIKKHLKFGKYQKLIFFIIMIC